MTHRPDISLLLQKSAEQEWRAVPGFPDYQISNDGRLRRATPCGCRKIGALIRCFLDNRDYPTYGLTSPAGTRHNIGAHVLVARAFLPPRREDQPYALHRDDNEMNCTAENLRWGNHQDNMDDAKANGRFRSGPEHGLHKNPEKAARGTRVRSAKIDDFQAAQIMVDPRPQSVIGLAYGLSQSAVSLIKTGKNWGHSTGLKT